MKLVFTVTSVLFAALLTIESAGKPSLSPLDLNLHNPRVSSCGGTTGADYLVCSLGAAGSCTTENATWTYTCPNGGDTTTWNDTKCNGSTVNTSCTGKTPMVASTQFSNNSHIAPTPTPCPKYTTTPCNSVSTGTKSVLCNGVIRGVNKGYTCVPGVANPNNSCGSQATAEGGC